VLVKSVALLQLLKLSVALLKTNLAHLEGLFFEKGIALSNQGGSNCGFIASQSGISHLKQYVNRKLIFTDRQAAYHLLFLNQKINKSKMFSRLQCERKKNLYKNVLIN
jgi:hypothetical protein